MTDRSVYYETSIQGVHNTNEAVLVESRIYKFRRKCLPPILGGMICFSFGMMLGWPSPMFLKLLEGESPAVIFAFSTSSLLAAYLMIGNIFGSFFSIFNKLSLNVTLVIGSLLQCGGWTVVFLGDNISLDWLYAGRLLVGFGNGFAFEKTKSHILKVHGLERGPTFNKLLMVYQIFGVLTAYSVGPFVIGPVLNLIGLLINLIIFVMLFLIPNTISSDNKGNNKVTPNQQTTEAAKTAEDDLKWGTLIYRAVFLVLLVLVQQFTGLAACLVYNQYIFTEFDSTYPELFSIIYAILYICSNLVGNFYLAGINRKYCLIFSNISVVAILFSIITIIYVDLPSEKYYFLTPLFYFYIIFHTIGLGVVPFALGPLLFPKKYRRYVSHIQMMFFCAFAITITKLFQVTFDAFKIFGPFALHCIVAICAVPLLLFFIPNIEEKPKNKAVEMTSIN